MSVFLLEIFMAVKRHLVTINNRGINAILFNEKLSEMSNVFKVIMETFD